MTNTVTPSFLVGTQDIFLSPLPFYTIPIFLAFSNFQIFFYLLASLFSFFLLLISAFYNHSKDMGYAEIHNLVTQITFKFWGNAE